MYTREQFLTDVAAEAMALKEHATKEERDRLDIYMLNPNSKEECVYGLMTGNCNSPRALELIEKCCTRFFYNRSNINSFEKVVKCVNGNTCDIKNRGPEVKYFSSIETYIYLEERNKNLIAFLRDETKDLVL